jgi:nicotinamidase-related amidase
MAERALIVIDVQNDYFPGYPWALPHAERALPNIVRLIATARERGEPVVFIQHVTPEGSPVFARGSKGGLLRAELGARPGDPVFEKQHPSSFQGTGLRAFLDPQGIRALDLCGYMTQQCCDTTAREAYARGYTVRAFSDAMAARDLTFEGVTIPHGMVHGATLATLARFAKVLPAGQA